MVGNDGCDFMAEVAAGLGVDVDVGAGDVLELGVDGIALRRGVVNLALARSNGVRLEEEEDGRQFVAVVVFGVAGLDGVKDLSRKVQVSGTTMKM
jgi:hypothetical protein